MWEFLLYNSFMKYKHNKFMRDILLCDLNNFYASCEVINDSSIKDLPVAVSGSVEDRKGVVIACNYLAKKYGVKAGDIFYQAKSKCPNLVVKECNFALYNHYSKLVREIYLKYTDRVEPFSIDECYLDVTNSKIFGQPEEIAYKIKEEVKQKYGLTLSVGVSFNKSFAKLASEFKKPDAVSVVNENNYKEKVWGLPINEFCGIGKNLKIKLNKYNIITLGDLANTDVNFLIKVLGKVGKDLHDFANGEDEREVELYSNYVKPKSVGNSTTFYRDLTKYNDIVLGFSVISDSIVERMIKYNINGAKTLTVSAKDNLLNRFSKHISLPYYTRSSKLITNTAVETFYKYFKLNPIRQLGLTVSNFDNGTEYENIFKTKGEVKDIDKTIIDINNKFNKKALFKANNLIDKKIAKSFEREQLTKKD